MSGKSKIDKLDKLVLMVRDQEAHWKGFTWSLPYKIKRYKKRGFVVAKDQPKQEGGTLR